MSNSETSYTQNHLFAELPKQPEKQKPEDPPSKSQKNGKIKKDKIELFDDNGQSRGFYSTRNALNELTGKEWVYWSKSVINKPYPPNCQHKLRSQHGGQKPPDLCADLIKIFTKPGQSVLDPFAGVGGSLLGASLCGRKALGIELNQSHIDVYKEVCFLENLKQQKILCGDSREVLKTLLKDQANFDFLLTDVPYWNMDTAQRSRGNFKKVGEKLKEKRQSKLKVFNEKSQSKEEWLAELKEIFQDSIPLLKEKAYLAIFIGDMYHSGQYHFLTADLANILQNLGLTMKANNVWYDVSKSLHVYGYLYQYIPSMIHQNILIFCKE